MEHKSNRPRGLNRRGFLAVTTSTVALLAAAKAKAQEIEAQKRGDAAEPLANFQGASGRRAETELRINGQIYRIAADTRTSLLDALRDHIGLTGTKKGCDHGQCGACTVHVDGVATLSCLTLAAATSGKEVTTIEGLQRGGNLHPMQQAFIDHDAFQCGYCTPGQIMSAVACVNSGQATSDDDIREFMSGNLCRCAAYPNIVAAIRQAKQKMEKA